MIKKIIFVLLLIQFAGCCTEHNQCLRSDSGSSTTNCNHMFNNHDC